MLDRLISTDFRFSVPCLNSCFCFRQNHRHQVGRLEEVEGPRPEEDLERVGRELRRLPREGRLHQEDRTAEAEICQKRAVKPSTISLSRVFRFF